MIEQSVVFYFAWRILNLSFIVVGHSLRPAFLLNIIEELDRPIKAAFFVSGFLDLLGNPDFDNINKSFIEKSFDWQKIKQNCSARNFPKFFFHFVPEKLLLSLMLDKIQKIFFLDE